MESPRTCRVDVVRTHLELRDPRHFVRVHVPDEPVQLTREDKMTPEGYLELYRTVGERWHWTDRLEWSLETLRRYLADPDISVWVLRGHSADAGFFELRADPIGHVEVMYFGLVPAFIGRRLGGWLLTRAVEEAFALGADRVMLNTCTLDAPQALPNYIARGFRIVREERYSADVSIRGGHFPADG